MTNSPVTNELLESVIAWLELLSSEWTSVESDRLSRSSHIALQSCAVCGLVELEISCTAWSDDIDGRMEVHFCVSGQFESSDLTQRLRECIPNWSDKSVTIQPDALQVRLTEEGRQAQADLARSGLDSIVAVMAGAANPQPARIGCRINKFATPSANTGGVVSIENMQVNVYTTKTREKPDGDTQPEHSAPNQLTSRFRRWDGAYDWQNWGVGIEYELGKWHLFHFNRTNGNWIVHRHDSLRIPRGWADQLAREFIRRHGVIDLKSAHTVWKTCAKGGTSRVDREIITATSPLLSRLGRALREAVTKEGYQPKGVPICSIDDEKRWRAVVKFGTAARRDDGGIRFKTTM